jgi:hypothetical protein
MSFANAVKRDPRFTKENVARALSEAAYETAREGTKIQQKKMQASVPAGTLYTVARGGGYVTRTRASKKGQYAALRSRRLFNSYRAKKTGEYSAELSCIAETDEGFNYSEHLQKNMGRKILPDEDKLFLQNLYFKRCVNALSELGR